MQITVSTDGEALIPVQEPKEMLSFRELPSGDLVVRINFSSLALAQECWRKFEYVILRNLRSNLESPATLFGSAIHRGLEVFYSGSSPERRVPAKYDETWSMIACGIWEPEWEGELLFRALRAFVLKAAPLKLIPPDNKRSIATGVWLLAQYLRTNINDPYVVLFDAKGPMVERKFTLPFGSFLSKTGRRVLVDGFGQIDVVLRHEISGQILPTDHKTTSQLGSQFYQRIDPNFQYTFYLWAAREIYGLDTNSFLVNALQVKERPKTSRGTPPQYARQVTTRSEQHFEELKEAVFSSVESFLIFKESGKFPMSAPGPCSNYGGCQFHDLCAAPAQLRENIIKAKYKTTDEVRT